MNSHCGHAGIEPTASSNKHLNFNLFDSSELVESYSSTSGLTPAEQVLVDRWVQPGSEILDLGVGTGRTYNALASKASRYVGVDFAPVMVDSARRNHPAGCFAVHDASDLSAFPDASFDVVMFSFNGLDYLHPLQNRRQALREIHRVLRPGGRFIFSSHNPRAVFIRPSSVRTPSSDLSSDQSALGAKKVIRRGVIAALGSIRASRSLLFSKVFWRGSGYEVDRIQPLLTYYATAERISGELNDAGFETVQVLGGDHPFQRHTLVSPWTYVAAIRSSRKNLHIDAVTDAADIEALTPDWERLAASSGSGVFQSKAWIDAWHRVLVPDASPVVLVAREGETGRVIGLLPLAWMSRSLHRRLPLSLRYLGLAGSGSGAADHLGPLTGDDLTAIALFKYATGLAGRRSTYFESVAPRWVPLLSAIPSARYLGSTTCPVNTRRADGSFSDTWSPKFRKNVRRRARLLEEAGVRARWVATGPDMTAALLTLRDLHTRRWRAVGRPGLFDDTRENFLADFADMTAGTETVWVLLLENDDYPIGALLGFVHGQTFSVYKTGWDPSCDRFSVGTALGAEAMRWAEQRGLTVFDYLRGSRRHKTDLGCRPTYDQSFIIPRGVEGAMLHWRERLRNRSER